MSAPSDPARRLASSFLRELPFLRIPPFPGARMLAFVRLPQAPDDAVSLAKCISLAREARVGGTFWAAQPCLPSAYLLVCSEAALALSAELVEPHCDIQLWLPAPPIGSAVYPTTVGECDPWHMLANASALVCDPHDEVRIIAAILGVPTYLVDRDSGKLERCDAEQHTLLAEALSVARRFLDPFDGRTVDLADLIKLCGFWRSLIDSNRSIKCGVGFSFWKQASVLPLLWGGGDSSAFFRPLTGGDPHGAAAIWRSRASHDVFEQLDRQGTPLVEVEDGFLRSQGLGAHCVPPLSITVDRLGPYFDPAQASELENLLEHGSFGQPLVARARILRETIVAAGLGKYDRGEAILDRFDTTKRHILVAGQVEDDRSILTGGAGLASNLDLLKRVREREPDAYLIYKPHPDVVAGHRKGDIPEQMCRNFADKVVTEGSISSLIAMVDEVHVNTSLAGFEALMRHKDVTTYGVPFYAGWGLTRDLGPVPVRRTATRSLDELVAAALLIYPRYLDPVTGLPCPAEVVVDRLCAGVTPHNGLLVAARRMQGKLMRHLQWLAR